MWLWETDGNIRLKVCTGRKFCGNCTEETTQQNHHKVDQIQIPSHFCGPLSSMFLLFFIHDLPCLRTYFLCPSGLYWFYSLPWQAANFYFLMTLAKHSFHLISSAYFQTCKSTVTDFLPVVVMPCVPIYNSQKLLFLTIPCNRRSCQFLSLIWVVLLDVHLKKFVCFYREIHDFWYIFLCIMYKDQSKFLYRTWLLRAYFSA